jgi:hypothetical protein
MGSDPDAAGTMRWKRSHTELMHVKFFDTLSREWLIRFVEHRIGDDHPPDAEVAEGGCAGGRPTDRDDGWDAARPRVPRLAPAFETDDTGPPDSFRHCG